MFFFLNLWKTREEELKKSKKKRSNANEWAEFQFHRLNVLEIFYWIAINNQSDYTFATFFIRIVDFFVLNENRKFDFLSSFLKIFKVIEFFWDNFSLAEGFKTLLSFLKWIHLFINC